MKIGILGAGHIGGTLANRLATLGHEVRVANSRAPETVPPEATATGATAVGAAEVAEDADLVIVSIPQWRTPELSPTTIAARRSGAPVIDTNNYYPKRDGRLAAIEDGQAETEWVAGILGTDAVFKVFNGIYWLHLRDRGVGAGDPGRIALPVAGPAGADQRLVFDLVNALGFDPVDAGPLAESWRQQPGTPVYGKDFDVAGVQKALAEASPERPSEFRA